MYPLPEGMFAPRNQWYIAAWSSELSREPFERWILNQPVAFYRTSDGTPVALQGRCPHRHFPLGKSRVVGDNIECGYHGLTFDPTGACVHIPSQTKVPAACAVHAYPIVEKWKWLWIWPGDPALADAALIPDHDAMGLPDENFTLQGDVYYAVPGRHMLMHDNLLDLTHLGYLHQSTIGADGLADAPEERTDGPGWIRSDRSMAGTECPSYFSKVFGYEGQVERSFALTFRFPCLHEGFDEFRRPPSSDGKLGDELGTARVYHAVTPGRLNDAHYFFAMGRNFARDDDAFGQAMLDGIRVTLDEDMSATREIEAMLTDLQHLPQEVLLRADAHCMRGRQLFEKMIKEEQETVAAAVSG
jgi:phenylpropionate dioxygenase-like ring-hydroxylating dioxygenase large terminal subunit